VCVLCVCVAHHFHREKRFFSYFASRGGSRAVTSPLTKSTVLTGYCPGNSAGAHRIHITYTIPILCSLAAALFRYIVWIYQYIGTINSNELGWTRSADSTLMSNDIYFTIKTYYTETTTNIVNIYFILCYTGLKNNVYLIGYNLRIVYIEVELLFFSQNYLVVRYQLYIQAVRWILSWSYIREHILFLTIQSDSDEYVFIFRNTMMFILIDEYFLHTQVRVKQVHCVVRILYTYI